ncbi:hypothetical protein BOTU111921_11205 [Bordetella tumbae]
MWICRHCGVEAKAGETDAEHDEDGFYFRCRRCQCRNGLIDAARRDVGSAVGLIQPDP